MGTVYRKSATKPLPSNAKLIVRKGERFAEWIDAKLKRRTAPVTTGQDGTERIVIVARTFTAKYRDGSGVVREVATGCRDEAAARSLLTELEKRAEKVKGKILSADEANAIDHQQTPLSDHIDAFLLHQTGKGVSPVRTANNKSQLNRIKADCGFRTLADLSGTALERWLIQRQAEKMGAATRNGYREAWITFANWCVANHRLTSNPFSRVPKADAKADPKRQRRALTEIELQKLLTVARDRPVRDLMTINRGKRKGEVAGKLSDATRQRLERLGWERALIYKTLVLTGLRKGELASLTVGQIDLDGPMPYIVLNAADEKNRQGSTIPLRDDLADDLRAWIASKVDAGQGGDEAVLSFQQPKITPRDTKLFNVPTGLIRILNRDLSAAGISKRDERGRTIDVHAMRHTFGTLLSKGGVAPRTAQAAMRHSSIDLTMNVYTDPKLLDVAGALDSLPNLSLDHKPTAEPNVLSATGTTDLTPSQFAPKFAPTTGKPSTNWSIPDRTAVDASKPDRRMKNVASAMADKEIRPLSSSDKSRHKVGVTGFEPATSTSRT